MTGSAEPAKKKEAKNVIVVAVSDPKHDLPSAPGSLQELNNEMFFTSSAWLTALGITPGFVLHHTLGVPQRWPRELIVYSIPDLTTHSSQVQPVGSAFGKCLTCHEGTHLYLQWAACPA